MKRMIQFTFTPLRIPSILLLLLLAYHVVIAASSNPIHYQRTLVSHNTTTTLSHVYNHQRQLDYQDLNHDNCYIVRFQSNECYSNHVQEYQDIILFELPQLNIVLMYITDETTLFDLEEKGIGLVEKDTSSTLLFTDPDTTYTRHAQEKQQEHRRETEDESIGWNIDMVKALQVSDEYVSKKKVCIISSGYDMGHEDLPGSDTVSGFDEGSGIAWNEDISPVSHGTSNAGVITALGNNNKGVVGIIRNGELNMHIVKIFRGDGTVWSYTILKALESCVDAKADIITMPFTWRNQTLLREAVNDLYENSGILFISESVDEADKQIPGSLPSVIAVAALDSTKQLTRGGPNVDISAPGSNDIITTTINNTYGNTTAFTASSHVAGVAALIWSHHPDISNKDIRECIQLSAEDLGDEGVDEVYGFGLVRADLAKEYCDRRHTIQPSNVPSSSPTIACIDDDSFLFNDIVGQTCDWVGLDETRRNNLCSNSEAVLDSCPFMCGLCCRDDKSFRFSVNDKSRDCEWIENKNKPWFCDDEVGGTLISDKCPVSCNACKDPAYTNASVEPSTLPTIEPSLFPSISPSIKPSYTPTASPTILLSMSPSSSPSMLPSSISSIPSSSPTITCIDDDSFLHNDIVGQTCKWVGADETRRNNLCSNSEAVLNVCPFMCGTCCQDDTSFRFDVPGNDKRKACKWIVNKDKPQFCDDEIDGILISDKCPVSCNACKDPAYTNASVEPSTGPSTAPTSFQPTTSPSTAPSISDIPTSSPTRACVDDDIFLHNGIEGQTCEWVGADEIRRNNLCSNKEAVLNACPLICGQCCHDDMSYRFTVPSSGQIRPCLWIWYKEKPFMCNKVIDGVLVSDKCPNSCRKCREPAFDDPSSMPSIDLTEKPSLLPTLIPSIIQTTSPSVVPTIDRISTSPSISPSNTCVDDASFLFNDVVGQTCDWVGLDETRRSNLCSNSEAVLSACPFMCGICCQDDTSFRFDVPGNENSRKCAWIVNKNKPWFCNKDIDGVLISAKCPVSCNACRDPTYPDSSEEPSAPPSLNPTSTLPSMIPSFMPSSSCQDDKSFRFSANGKSRACAWIVNKNKPWFCNREVDGKLISDSCPASCNTCEDPPLILPTMKPTVNTPPSITPSVSSLPSSSPCIDDDNFLHDNIAGQTCDWVGSNEVRRNNLCSTNNAVKVACPFMCGTCCQDDGNYEFTVPKTGFVRKCAWIYSLQDKNKPWICNKNFDGIFVSEKCQVVCNACRDPPSIVEMPSVEPSPQPTACVNDPSFRFKETRDCNSLYSTPVKNWEKFCSWPNVRRSCSAACRACCGDNDQFVFDGDKTCDSIADSPEDSFCELNSVKYNCKHTCDSCDFIPPWMQ